MKLTEMAINAILKKGVLYEGEEVELEFDIPMSALTNVKSDDSTNSISIKFKAKSMSLRIEKTES
jgi:hypothetical protein